MYSISKQANSFLSNKLPLVSIILKGIGQIMLQENAITGLLFLIGISIGSINMGIATIVSVVSGNIIAILLKYDKKEVEAGLYGFSPALVGVALLLFYQPSIIVWISVIIGSMLAAILQHFFIIKKIPAFTFPFVLVTWIIFYIFNNIYPVEASEATSSIINNTYSIYLFALKGIGQVIFQDKLIIGIIFLIGILVNSPIAALYALIGSVISGWMAGFMSMPLDTIYMGLFSYNAVLCAIVFADKRTDAIGWAAISVMLSLLIAIVMYQLKLTQLTFPFVASTVITLAIKKRIENKLKIASNRQPTW